MSASLEVRLIPVTTIAAPSFVRTSNGHDKESLSQLAASIKAHGLLQPIVVRPPNEDEAQAGTGWVVIAGRRRLAAFKLAGLPEIPAMVTSTDEARSYELEIAENIQREQMTLADTARAVRTLMTIYNNAKKVSEILNKSPAWVSKHLAVTSSKCPETIKDLMDRGLVTDLETLVLLKQIAEMPASHPDAASALTRMLRIANEGNMNRVLARDTLAKLRAPRTAATANTTAPATVKTTTTRTLAADPTEPQTDPAKEFTVALPIELLAQYEMAGGREFLIRVLQRAEEYFPTKDQPSE